MRFRYFCENVISGAMDLPPIPPNSVRLTHFTSEGIAQQIVIGGQSFIYKNGLESTSDPFSDNEHVFDLIKNGSYASFNRSHFGNCVLLMDVPNDQHRIHRSLTAAPGNIDNRQILGYVKTDTMELVRNPRYNPSAVQLQPKMQIRATKPVAPQSIMRQEPQPTTADNLDVW